MHVSPLVAPPACSTATALRTDVVAVAAQAADGALVAVAGNDDGGDGIAGGRAQRHFGEASSR